MSIRKKIRKWLKLSSPLKSDFVIFKGWKNDAVRDRFQGSVEICAFDIIAKDVQPIHPLGLFDIRPMDKSQVASIGTKLKIRYWPDMVSLEEIKAYCNKIGLIVE